MEKQYTARVIEGNKYSGEKLPQNSQAPCKKS